MTLSSLEKFLQVRSNQETESLLRRKSDQFLRQAPSVPKLEFG